MFVKFCNYSIVIKQVFVRFWFVQSVKTPICPVFFYITRNLNLILFLGVQIDRGREDDGSHCCLVAIGRLQVTSAPNCSDIMGNSSNEFISRITVEGKMTFVDQRYVWWLAKLHSELLPLHSHHTSHLAHIAYSKQSINDSCIFLHCFFNLSS